jgi:hypothetical protein
MDGFKKNKHTHPKLGLVPILWGTEASGGGSLLKVGMNRLKLITLFPGKVRSAWKERIMNHLWKKFFALDFEKEFFVSFLKLLLFWNPIWTFLVSLLLEGFNLFRWEMSFFEATVVGLLGMAMLRLFLLAERRWISWESQSHPKHGIGWYLFFLAFMAPPGFYLASHLWVAYLNFKYNLGSPVPPQFPWRYYGTEIFWGWTLLLLFFLFKSLQDLRDAVRLGQIRAEEMEKERLQALLTKLKDQMNPHFLFNTLNTVAALIPADPSKAEQVVVKLSSLYQGLLAATQKSNHPLEKELAFCKDYLDIERVRFGKRLNVRLEIQPGMETEKILVPVLLLQPLVENAIKHGLSSRASGGLIEIRAEIKDMHLELRVEDDGVGFGKSPYAGSGTALENCRKRLELGFGKEGRMEIIERNGGGTAILMILPVLKSDPSVQEER